MLPNNIIYNFINISPIHQPITNTTAYNNHSFFLLTFSLSFLLRFNRNLWVKK
nr:MAG TPA: hypothetical protein [Caudoviricetes sp.]